MSAAMQRDIYVKAETGCGAHQTGARKMQPVWLT